MLILNHKVDDANPGATKQDWSQWSQGIEANFKSGYLADVIGFDASYYGALKLDHTGIEKHGDMGGQLLGKGGEGYHKLGQAYVKAKLGDEHLGFYGQAGYMSGSKGLILGSGSRSTPSSYRGLHGEVNVDDFSFYASYVDRIGFRTESSWDKFTTAAGDIVDNAWQVGGTYNANNFTSELVYLESKDYRKEYMLNLGYTFDINEDMKLVVDGNFHRDQENGNLFGKSYIDSDGKAQKTGTFDDKAYHLNLNTQLVYKGLGVMLSYAQTDAEKTGELGYFNYMFADNEYGASPSQVSRYVSDFMYDGEKVWQLSASYNFADLSVPGLDATLSHTRGSNIQGSNQRQDEQRTRNRPDCQLCHSGRYLQGCFLQGHQRLAYCQL